MKKAALPLTIAVTKKELVKSFNSAVVHRFKVGDCIVTEGHVSDSCFYLVKGRVQISKRMKKGLPVKLGILGSGQFFGEMAMLSGQRRSATVTALTAVEAVEIDRSEFEQLAQSHHSVAGSIALHFSVQMANRINRLLKLLAKHSDTQVKSEPDTEPVDVRQVLHKVYSFWAV